MVTHTIAKLMTDKGKGKERQDVKWVNGRMGCNREVVNEEENK
jgi:hypothetical protein